MAWRARLNIEVIIERLTSAGYGFHSPDSSSRVSMLPERVARAAVLRRILAGERGETPLDGLGPVDYAIVHQTLARLT